MAVMFAREFPYLCLMVQSVVVVLAIFTIMAVIGIITDYIEDPDKFIQERINPNHKTKNEFQKKVAAIEKMNLGLNKGKQFSANSDEDARLISRAKFSQQNKLAMALAVAEEMKLKQKQMEEKEILEEVERLKKLA